MNCNFDKFKNLMSLYGNLIDAILDSQVDLSTKMSEKDINNLNLIIKSSLTNYLANFKDSMRKSDASEFFNEFSIAVENALEMVGEELPTISSNVADSSNVKNLMTLVFKQPSVYEDIHKNLQEKINVRYDEIEQNPTKEEVEQSISLNRLGFNAVSLNAKLNVDVPSDILDINDILLNYYGSAANVETKAKSAFFREMVKIRLIEIYKHPRAKRLEVLNSSIEDFKNKLKESLLVSKAFKNKKKISDKPLKEVLGIFEKYMMEYNGVGITPRDLIFHATNYTPESAQFINSYNAFVQLKHFDDIITDYSNNLITTRPNEIERYIFSKHSTIRRNWNSEDDVIAAADETSEIYKSFIETLQKINRNGQLVPNEFIGFSEVTHTISKLKADIRFSDPVGSIKTALETAIQQKLNNRQETRSLKERDLRVMLSLYANVFYDGYVSDSYGLLKKLMSEIKTTDSLNQMYSGLHPNDSEMNLVDIMAVNILKTDTLKYSEIVYDFQSRSQVTKETRTKLSNSMLFRLKVLGNSVIRVKKDKFEQRKINYDFDIVSTKRNDKLIRIGLDSTSVYYDPAQGQFYKQEGDDYEIVDNVSDIIKVPKSNISTNEIFSNRSTYADYLELIDKFDLLLEQDLISDNYNLLDLLRDEDGAAPNHANYLTTLLSNYIFLSYVNANSINGVIMDNNEAPLTKYEIINQISPIVSQFKGIAPEDLWDHKFARFNIALGDEKSKGSIALQAYANAYNILTKNDIKAVTTNSEGKMLPTSAITSPINNFRMNIEDAKAALKKSKTVLQENIFVKSPYGLLNSIEIRSTIKNSKGVLMHPSKLNVLELLKTSILTEFLSNKVNDKMLRFQPTNFADKSRHSLLVIDPDANVALPKMAIKKWKDLKVEEFQNLFFDNEYAYYSNLWNIIRKDYKTIVDNGMLLSSFLESTTILKEFVTDTSKAINYNKVDSYYKGDKTKKEVETFNKIIKLKNTLKILDNPKADEKPYTSLFKDVNEVLGGVSTNVLMGALNASKIDWVNNLYFEKGKNGALTLNETLEFYLQKYSPNAKDETIKSIEDDFIKGLEDNNFSLDIYNLDMQKNNILLKAYQKYPTLINFEDTVTGTLKLRDDDGELNPLLKDYLWQANVVGRNFQEMTVGSILGHPAKANRDGVNVANSLIAQRLVQQNKRMVRHQGTFHPYMQNIVKGVPAIQNRFYVSDPSAKVFAPHGINDSVETTDGASISDFLSIILYNNSLLDQSVDIIHKSLGSEINPVNGAAGLTKHALHGISNMEIKNSPYYKSIIKKTLGRNFHRIGDQPIFIQDITKDYDNRVIDPVQAVGEIAFVFKNQDFFSQANQEAGLNLEYGELIKFLKLEKTDQGYVATYQRGNNPSDTIAEAETFQVLKPEINTLYDIWEMFGEDYSVSFEEEQVGLHRNAEDPLDGYIPSNTSWHALAHYVNSVGFWNNVGVDKNSLTISNVAVDTTDRSRERIKENYNKLRFRPVKGQSDLKNKEYNQDNIIQPLKLNHIGQITFFGAQKVGIKNAFSFDDLVSDKKSDELPVGTSDLRFYGIQLNSDHAVDESKVTEPTQVIGTVTFHGDTVEITNKVLDSISHYITINLEDYFDASASVKLTKEQRSKIYKLIRKTVLKSFKNKDLSGVANAIVLELKKEREAGESGTVSIPYSSPTMYNMLNTAVSNFFTDEGIRRKMPGVTGVLKPYNPFIKFRSVPGIGVMTEDKFKDWQYEQEQKGIDLNALDLQSIDVNDINIFDSLMDSEGENFSINTPLDYIKFKRNKKGYQGQIYKSTFSARDLMPSHHTWGIEGLPGRFTYYDNPISSLQHSVTLINQSIDKYNRFLEESKQEISSYENALYNDTTKEERIIGALAEVNKEISLYNQLLKRSKLTIRKGEENIEIIKPLPLIQSDNDVKVKKINFTTREFNFLKNNHIETLKRLQDEKLAPIPAAITEVEEIGDAVNEAGTRVADMFNTIKSTNPSKSFEVWLEENPELLIRVTDVKNELGEMALDFPFRSLFGIAKDLDVSDISPETFQNNLDRRSLGYAKADFFISESQGNHLYFVIEGSRNHEELKKWLKKGQAESKRLRTETDDNGVIYQLDVYGNRHGITPSNTVYKVRGQGKRTFDYMILPRDLQALSNIANLVEKNPSYNRITPFLNADHSLLPFYREAIENGINIGLNEKNAKLVSDIALTYESVKNKPEQEIFELKFTDVYNLENINQIIESKTSELKAAEVAGEQFVFANLKAHLELLNKYRNFLLAGEIEKAEVFSKQLSEQVLADKNQERFLDNVEAGSNVSKKDRTEAFQSIKKSLTLIQSSMYKNIKHANRREAQALFANFTKALENIGARIPGQDLQSYDAQKIVHFLSGITNAVYQSPTHQWTTGEDFDIDKVFLMFLMFLRNGRLAGWSKFWNVETPENIRKSLDLPIPDMVTRTFKKSVTPDLTLAEIKLLEKENVNDLEFLSKNRNYGMLVDIIVKTANTEEVLIPDGMEPGLVNKLEAFINNFYTDSLPDDNADKGMLNGIVSGLIDLRSSLKSAIHGLSPMNFGDYGEIAKTSKKAEKIMNLSPDNPVSIHIAQGANMIGKESIGVVAAAGLKSLTIVSKAMVDLADKGIEFNARFLPSIVYWDVEDQMFKTKPFTGLKGPNLTDRLERVKVWLDRVTGQDIPMEVMVNDLLFRESVSLNDSALLSAATDNAKELILARINANPDTLGYFLAGHLLGMDPITMAKLMTSGAVDLAVDVAQGDIYNNFIFKFPEALRAVTSGTLDTNMYFTSTQSYNVWKNLRDVEFEINGKKLTVSEYNAKFDEEFEKKKNFGAYQIRRFVNNILRSNFKIEFFEGKTNNETDNEKVSKEERYKILLDVISKIENSEEEPTPYDYEEDPINVRRSNMSQEEAMMRAQENEEQSQIYASEVQQELDNYNDVENYSEHIDDAEYMQHEILEGMNSGFRTVKKPWRYVFSKYALDTYNKLHKVELTESDIILLENLEYVGKLKNDIELISRLASVNQSVKNDYYSMVNFIKGIATYMRTNFPLKGEIYKDMTDRDLVNELFNNAEFRKQLDIDFLQVEDENFTPKTLMNVLKILEGSSHIWAMLKTALTTLNIWDISSFKNRMKNDIFSKIEVNLTQDNSIIFDRFVDDAFLSWVMSNMSDEDASFNVRTGDISDHNDRIWEVDSVINVKDYDGRKEFVDWMENTVIPYLKEGQLRDDNGDMFEDSKIKNNVFLRRLSPDQFIDRLTGEMYTYYRLPIDMLNITNTNQQVLADLIKSQFSELENYTFDGHNLVDMFFFYNLIVNKDKNNANSLTSLIQSTSDINADNVRNRFLKLIGNLDSEPEVRATIGVKHSDDDVNDDSEINLMELYKRGFAKEARYVPKRVSGDANLDAIPKVIKKLVRDDDNDSWVHEIYYLVQDGNDFVYNMIHNPFQHRIKPNKYINVSSPKGEGFLEVNKDRNMKNRLKKFIAQNLKINLRPC